MPKTEHDNIGPFQLLITDNIIADPGGRTVEGVGLRPLACWEWGFESRHGHGRLSLVSVVCCRVEFSGSG